MPFYLIRHDITQMHVDAIVNAANSSLLGGGGVDGAIHRAAGPKLLAECRTLGGCPTGESRITRGYDLPAKYVIHTVGPIYRDGRSGEPLLLESCYRTALQLAQKHHCETVAFPLISAGVYGYPRADAIRIAADTIRAFLDETDDTMTVTLVIFDRDSMAEGRAQFPDIASYIDDRYAAAHADPPSRMLSRRNAAYSSQKQMHCEEKAECMPLFDAMPCAQPSPKKQKKPSLIERLSKQDESFSEMLLRKIDESGMTDAQCYKKANIDRKLFSKIRSDKHYKPSKQTVLAFAIALHLPLSETKLLLERAGFALSHASKFDIIVEYFIETENYDVFAINEALFAFDQTLLGA